MADDTKKDQRVKAPVLRAKYKSRTLDEFIEKYSRDISRSGMWIKSAKPPALGTLLKVEILLDDGSPVISAVGRVVKRREEAEASADNPAGMGIRFLKMEEASQPVIDRIVALKGEDAGPHFENIRTGGTVPPPNTGESHSAFFGATNPSKEMPPDADRTMMRQMNALLGEALRQVNESAPRKPGDATQLPTQKATIMGVAAPAGMLEQAIAASREEGKKPDDAPAKSATRSEIDKAVDKLKSVEEPTEAPKAEALKTEAAKTEAPKVDAPKADAPKAEVPKVDAPKADAPKPDAPKPDAPKPDAPKPDAPKAEVPKVDAKKSEVPKPEAPKADLKKPDEKPVVAKTPEKKPETPALRPSPPPRSVTTRTGSVPPPPSTRPIEVEATAKIEERGSAPPAEAKKPDEKPVETPKVEGSFVEETKPVEAPKLLEAANPEATKTEAAKVDEKPVDEPKDSAATAPDGTVGTVAEAKPVEADKADADKPAVEASAPEPDALATKPEEKSEDKPELKPEVVAKVEESKIEAKPEVKPAVKAEAKPAEKKPEVKKATPPEPQGNAMNMVVTVAIIAALAFAVYWFLLRGPEAGMHPRLDEPSDVSATLANPLPRS